MIPSITIFVNKISSTTEDIQIWFRPFCIFALFKISLLRILLYIVEGLEEKIIIILMYWSGKFLVLLQQGETFVETFFFFHCFWKNLDSQRYFKRFRGNPTTFTIFQPLILCFPLCFLSLCFFMIILLDISPDSISELEPIEVYRILKSIEEKCYSV